MSLVTPTRRRTMVVRGRLKKKALDSTRTHSGRANCFTVRRLKDSKENPIDILSLEAKDKGSRSRWITTFEATIRKMKELAGQATVPLEKKKKGVPIATSSSIVYSKHVPKWDSSKADVKTLASKLPKLKRGRQSKGRLQARVHVLREVVESQKSYVSDLKRCVELYHEPLLKLARERNDESSSESSKSTTLSALRFPSSFFSGRFLQTGVTEDDLKAIFGHLQAIYGVDMKLLNDIDRAIPTFKRLQDGDDAFVTEASAALGGIVVGYVPFLMFYAQYAKNFETATKALERISTMSSVKDVLRKAESASYALDLQSYLVLPLKQLVRLRMFVAKLLGHTDRKHEDFSILLLALHKISQIAAAVEGDEGCDVLGPDGEAHVEGIRELIESFGDANMSFDDGEVSEEYDDDETVGTTTIKSDAPRVVTSAAAPPADDGEPAPPAYDDDMVSGGGAGTTMTTSVLCSSSVTKTSSDGTKIADGAEVSSEDAPVTRELRSRGEPYSLDVAAMLPGKLHADVREMLRMIYLPNMNRVRLVSTRMLEHATTKAKTMLENLTDGTRVRHLPSGGAVQFERHREGCRLMLIKGGICKGGRRDGSKIEIHPDGITIQRLADKSTHQFWPDGSSVHALLDGSRMQREADGTDIFVSTDGTVTQKTPSAKLPGEFTVTEKSKDGSTTTYFPGGSVKLVHPSGQWAQLDSDGTKIELLPDLTTELQTNPDGVQIFTSKDGTKRTVYPDGKSITRSADGTVRTVGSDGAVMVKSPGGSATQVDANGRRYTWGREGAGGDAGGTTDSNEGAPGDLKEDDRHLRSQKLVMESIQHLDELFAICVVGEFNSGKSSLINRMIMDNGDEEERIDTSADGVDERDTTKAGLLEVGVTPTTDRIICVRGTSEAGLPSFLVSSPSSISFSSSTMSTPARQKRSKLPIRVITASKTTSWLRGGLLFDTPGTNAIVKEHQEITEALIPNMDLVLFVTSADRPFTESESNFLSMIRSWRKSIVLVINKVDILKDSREVEQVREFVTESARDVLRGGNDEEENEEDLRVFAVSTKASVSEMDQLERFVKDTLTSDTHLYMKLKAIAGVAVKVCVEELDQCETLARRVEADTRAVETLDEQNMQWANELKEDMNAQLSRVDVALRDVCDRADEFFENELQIGNILALSTGIESIRRKFERTVVRDSCAEVEEASQGLVNWVLNKSLRQSTAGIDFLQSRLVTTTTAALTSPSSSSVIVGGSSNVGDVQRRADTLLAIESDRHEMLERARALAARELEELRGGGGGDRSAQGLDEHFVRKVSTSVLSSAALGIGGVGVSSLVAASLLDWSGLVGAGALILGGGVLLPVRRHRVKALFRDRMTDMRRDVRKALQAHGEIIVDSSVERMRESVGPFRRFLRIEDTRLDAEARAVRSIQSGLLDDGGPMRRN
eukprot:g1740.t1